jgi:hypothetical protein
MLPRILILETDNSDYYISPSPYYIYHLILPSPSLLPLFSLYYPSILSLFSLLYISPYPTFSLLYKYHLILPSPVYPTIAKRIKQPYYIYHLILPSPVYPSPSLAPYSEAIRAKRIPSYLPTPLILIFRSKDEGL